MCATENAFKTFHFWPDHRLDPSDEPFFEKHIPFVISFLVLKDEKRLKWDFLMQSGSDKKIQRQYLQELNEAIAFLLPPPSFIVGVSVFDDQKPGEMIDRFLEMIPS